MTEKNVGSCGAECSTCSFYKITCQGCASQAGKTFWAVEHMPDKICPLFDCAQNQKKIKNCGSCSELPCKMFTDLKDPSMSDEEHQKSIQLRISNLR